MSELPELELVLENVSRDEKLCFAVSEALDEYDEVALPDAVEEAENEEL